MINPSFPGLALGVPLRTTHGTSPGGAPALRQTPAPLAASAGASAIDPFDEVFLLSVLREELGAFVVDLPLQPAGGAAPKAGVAAEVTIDDEIPLETDAPSLFRIEGFPAYACLAEAFREGRELPPLPDVLVEPEMANGMAIVIDPVIVQPAIPTPIVSESGAPLLMSCDCYAPDTNIDTDTNDVTPRELPFASPTPRPAKVDTTEREPAVPRVAKVDTTERQPNVPRVANVALTERESTVHRVAKVETTERDPKASRPTVAAERVNVQHDTQVTSARVTPDTAPARQALEAAELLTFVADETARLARPAPLASRPTVAAERVNVQHDTPQQVAPARVTPDIAPARLALEAAELLTFVTAEPGRLAGLARRSSEGAKAATAPPIVRLDVPSTTWQPAAFNRRAASDRLTADLAESALQVLVTHAGAGVLTPSASSVTSPATPGSSFTVPSSVTVIAPPAAPPTDRESGVPSDTARQIVQTMRLQWSRGGGEARITLEPSHLGELTVSLKVDQGVVTVKLQAETPIVREWLQTHQQTLRQGLAEHQLTLDRLEIVGPSASDESRDREQRQPSGPAVP